MKANLREVRKSRRYSDEFKKELVADFEQGRHSVLELAKLHGIHFQSIYNWIYKFSTFNKKGYRVVEKKESSIKKVGELETRIKELEATVGRKQIEIDYLEKMIEIAEDEFGIDLKKNSSTSQSSGFGNTPTE